MVDGIRFPAQGNGQCVIDPSIIPALSMDHIDVLVDGASATYGSDAISGVINIILKRNMDGAITQARWTAGAGGKNRYLASAVWGRTWDGGQVTLSYEWYNDSPRPRELFTPSSASIFRPWGFDDRRPLGIVCSGDAFDRRCSAAGRRPHRHERQYRPRLHQLLCDSARHRPELGSGRQRHRPDGAVQRRDSGLGELQQRRQFGHQRAQEPFDPYHSAGTTRTSSAMAATSPSISG